MADFVRRLVSGDKARYKDEGLDLELDLAYITDNIIVMGYPATGLEGFYRNRREDAKRFLDHRHKGNYWVFNFCPVKENAYPADVFEGRVSRYPFPDHHAPPLAILPLVAREIRAWLDGSKERVAVLHCKAGKGRSGTMACAYLLSLAVPPQLSFVPRTRSVREKVKERAQTLMDEMPVDEAINADLQSERAKLSEDPVKHEIPDTPPSPPESDSDRGARKDTDGSLTDSETEYRDKLDQVLQLHTKQRMKGTASPSGKVKQGVSIPSQRRWLYYWSLLLAGQGPSGFWGLNPNTHAHAHNEDERLMKVRLTQITLRMREIGPVKANLLKAANALLDSVGRGKGRAAPGAAPGGAGQVWASLARYDDGLVGALERWERATRAGDGNMGVRGHGGESADDADVFEDEEWDKGKMVRCFARLGESGDGEPQKEDVKEGEKIVTHVLRPLSDERWTAVRRTMGEGEGDKATLPPSEPSVDAEDASINDITNLRVGDAPHGVVLDAHREVRVKLYTGRVCIQASRYLITAADAAYKVFMGWLWFIPRFHMGDADAAGGVCTLSLTRKEVDFPLGVGAYIVDLQVCMERCGADASPPARQGSGESRAGKGEPAALATALEAVTLGEVSQAVDAQTVGKE
ncbi:hypothetical protein EIP86_008230 [Pleurotus ostreatoroseus]|nr:hypothetical protein EIP86_008230 [Pleurotus ostreatoroseus]